MPSSWQRSMCQKERGNVLWAMLHEHPSGSLMYKLHGKVGHIEGSRGRPNRRPLEQPRNVALKAGSKRGRHPIPITYGM